MPGYEETNQPGGRTTAPSTSGAFAHDALSAPDSTPEDLLREAKARLDSIGPFSSLNPVKVQTTLKPYRAAEILRRLEAAHYNSSAYEIELKKLESEGDVEFLKNSFFFIGTVALVGVAAATQLKSWG